MGFRIYELQTGLTIEVLLLKCSCMFLSIVASYLVLLLVILTFIDALITGKCKPHQPMLTLDPKSPNPKTKTVSCSSAFECSIVSTLSPGFSVPSLMHGLGALRAATSEDYTYTYYSGL